MDVNLLAAQLQEVMQFSTELRRSFDVLRADYDALLATTQELIAERDQLKQQVAELRATNKQLTHMLWGRKSERRIESDTPLLPQFVSQFAEPEADSAVITANEQLQEKLDEEIIAACRAPSMAST